MSMIRKEDLTLRASTTAGGKHLSHFIAFKAMGCKATAFVKITKGIQQFAG
jgi:hypothetical protein